MNEMMLKAYFAMRRIMVRQNGQGMTEYGLILSLIAVAVIFAVSQLGGKLKDTFEHITSSFTAH